MAVVLDRAIQFGMSQEVDRPRARTSIQARRCASAPSKKVNTVGNALAEVSEKEALHGMVDRILVVL